MARPSLPVLPSKALVASAQRIGKDQRKQRIYHAGQGWQRECYRHYTICGEARFASTLFAHAMSRSTLHIARESKAGQEKVVRGKADELLEELFNGTVGQAQMLYALGLHMTIAGEAYLVGRKHNGEDIWEIIAVTEMDVSGEKWAIKYGENVGDRIPLLDSDVVIRIWRPHPANRMEADSPFRSLLPTLNEIEWLTKHIFAQVSSRLTNDILFLPNEMSFPPPPDVDGKPQQVANEAEAFLRMLAAQMMEALKGDGSPEDRMPIIVTAAGEDIGNTEILRLWSELDEKALEMRTEAIRRFALGMDIPPEQVLGVSGVGFGGEAGANHWQGWQVEESTIKLHIEPMLDLICSALTLNYIRPQLDPGSTEYVSYSTISLRLRPDRSREAFELYDRGELTAEALRRENGFEETDKPTPESRKAWLLQKIASGSATPEMVQAALTELGVVLDIPKPEELEEVNRQSRPDPSLIEHPEHPRTPIPHMPGPSETEQALLAACDALVLNALDRAGRKLLNARTRERGGPARSEIPFITAHALVQVNGESADLLKGAFDYAPQVLGEICDCQDMVGTLENYCLALFATKTPHSRAALAEYLSRVGVVTASVQPKREPALPPMTFNVNLPDSPVSVNLPENLVNLNVEAAKAPDVHVDVAASEINMPTEMTLKGLDFSNLPAPVVNVPPAQVEVQAAAAPSAPEVTVNVEPTPVTVQNKIISPEPKVTVNNNVEPTPVNIENTVEAPKPRRRVSEVTRDEDGLVKKVVTEE